MTDTREAFANAILDALRESVSEYDTPYIDRSSLTFACIDGRVDMLAAVDAILAEFLVVPRSEVATEYGVQFRGLVHGHCPEADIAKYRAVHVYGGHEDNARHRQTWTGPWSPLPEEKP